MTELSLNLTKVINAPVEKVFNAWLNSETLSKFMCPAPGMEPPRTETDGVQGGTFVVYMINQGKEVPHRGEYLEVKQYEKLVFTWVSPYSPEGSTVSILFEALSDSQTSLDFTHVKFLHEQARDDHNGGWTLILEHLAKLLDSSELEKTA